MKKYILAVFFIGYCSLGFSLKAQDQEIMQLILNVEKLNNLREIHSNMVKGYTVLVRGYEQVSSLSEGNFNIHKTFIDGLSEVSPVVRDYGKAREIVQLQTELLSAYKDALSGITKQPLYSFKEKTQLQQLYSGIFQKALALSQQTVSVLSSGVLKMSDGQRLESLDQLHREILTELNRIALLNEEVRQLADMRNRQHHDNSLLPKILLR